MAGHSIRLSTDQVQQIADSIGNRYFTGRAAFCAGYNVIPYPYIVLAFLLDADNFFIEVYMFPL